MERWSHDYSQPIAEGAAAQQVELCGQVTGLIRGSRDLSPALSRARVHCSVAISFHQGSRSPNSAGHVEDAFLHLEPFASHALCFRQFQAAGAVSGFCSLELMLQPPQACFPGLILA